MSGHFTSESIENNICQRTESMHSQRASQETVRARAQLQLEAKTIADAKTTLPCPSTCINGLRVATNDKAQSPVSYGLSGRLRQLNAVLDLRWRSRTRSFERRDARLDDVDDGDNDGRNLFYFCG